MYKAKNNKLLAKTSTCYKPVLMLRLNLSTSFWHKKSTVDCGAWIIPWFFRNTSTSCQLLRSEILIMNFLCDLLKVLHVSATNIIKNKIYALNVK